MTKPSDTLARLRARSKEAGRFVLPLDPAWADKAEAAYRELRQAELVASGDDPDSARRVAEARSVVDQIVAEAGANVAIFRFRRLSRAQYDEIVSRNPPTEAQREEDKAKDAKERRVLNLDTFGPDLVSSVLIDPPMTVEECAELLNGDTSGGLLSMQEAEQLKNSAMAAALSVPRVLPQGLTLP